MAKKRTYREFKQGIYIPENKEKCKNTTPIVYRSGLEMKVMRVLDRNPNIISWSSEKTIIPYKHPIKSAKAGSPQYDRYFVDFYMKIKVGEVIKEILIEVKPDSQTRKPTTHGNKKQSTILYENVQYAINTSKWAAATEYCKRKGFQFIIITEKNIDTILSS